MLESADRAVEDGRCRSGSIRLPTRQPEGADVQRRRRVGRIAPVIDEHRLAYAPSVGGRHVSAARQISDTALALPPELVRVADGPQRTHQRGSGDVRYIPDFVTGDGDAAALDVAHHVDVAGRAARP